MNDVKNCVETLVRDCDEVIVAYNLAGDDTSYFTVNGNIGGVYGLLYELIVYLADRTGKSIPEVLNDFNLEFLKMTLKAEADEND